MNEKCILFFSPPFRIICYLFSLCQSLWTYDFFTYLTMVIIHLFKITLVRYDWLRKLSQLWPVESFKLAPVSFSHDSLIIENLVAFWHSKIFQAHLILFCSRHEITHFSKEPCFLSGKKIGSEIRIWALGGTVGVSLLLGQFSEQSQKRCVLFLTSCWYSNSFLVVQNSFGSFWSLIQ